MEMDLDLDEVAKRNQSRRKDSRGSQSSRRARSGRSRSSSRDSSSDSFEMIGPRSARSSSKSGLSSSLASGGNDNLMLGKHNPLMMSSNAALSGSLSNISALAENSFIEEKEKEKKSAGRRVVSSQMNRLSSEDSGNSERRRAQTDKSKTKPLATSAPIAMGLPSGLSAQGSSGRSGSPVNGTGSTSPSPSPVSVNGSSPPGDSMGGPLSGRPGSPHRTRPESPAKDLARSPGSHSLMPTKTAKAVPTGFAPTERRGSISSSFLRGSGDDLPWSGRLGRKGTGGVPMDESTRAQVEGDNLLKKGRVVESFEYYNKAIQLDSNNPLVYVKRAVAHIKVQSYTAALADCDTAISLDSNCAIAFARKAKALFALNRNDEANEYVEKARAIDPKLKELKKLNANDIRNLRLGNIMGKPQGSNPKPVGPIPKETESSLFGRSLEDLMSEQKIIYPDLLVPEVLPFLIDRLHECDGLTSEGIFRLSIGSMELQSHLSSLANGYRLSNNKDPNVYAVVLKHFYRHLPEPLCQNFQECMEVCANYDKHDTSASLRRRKEMGSLYAIFSEETAELLKKLWEGMTEHARNAAILLFKLWGTLLIPENAKATKMSLENLALVFANGFLRDPDPSALSALASQPTCQRFVVYLYKYVTETQLKPEERLLEFPISPPNLISPNPKSGEFTDTSSPLTRSSEDSGSFIAPRPRPKQKSHEAFDRAVALGVWKSWGEFFEQTGLSGNVWREYAATFEREEVNLDLAMEFFGSDNMETLKGYGMKTGHVLKVQKFIRGTKSGSLGGTMRKKSTFKMLGVSSPDISNLLK